MKTYAIGDSPITVSKIKGLIENSKETLEFLQQDHNSSRSHIRDVEKMISNNEKALEERTFQTLFEFRIHLVNVSKEFTDKSISEIDFELLIDERLDEYIKNDYVLILED